MTLIIQKIWLISIILSLFGCQISEENTKKSEQFKQDIKEVKAKVSDEDDRKQQSYIKVSNSKDTILKKKIDYISIKNISLREMLNLAFPDMYIIGEGKDVDLKKLVSAHGTNISKQDLLDILSSSSDYRIVLEKSNKLVVSSVASRRWNVASLVFLPTVETTVGGNATAGDAENSTGITISKNDETWEDLLAGLEKIIEDGVIVDNRRLGEIYASGTPESLLLADQWMKKIVESSKRQVLLDVAIVEVALSDGEAVGLDWSAIYKNSSNANSIALNGKNLQALSDGNGGAWNLISKYQSGKIQLSSIVNLLKQHGNVTVQHQPSLTVTNGSTAYLGSSEKISYVANIVSTTPEPTVAVPNPKTTATAEIEELNIGLNIAVTARMLDDDDILIEVVPVISSLQGFDEFEIGENKIKAPKINLQELSTQVIAKSGQSIHLGGLIIERLTEASSKLPVESSILNFLTSSQKQELEKREILIIITPTEV